VLGFERRRSFDIKDASLATLEADFDALTVQRIHQIREYMNFYEGYHWEGVDSGDKPQLTVNYCRPFIDKFVAFELGESFTYQFRLEVQGLKVNDTQTLFEFLESVWVDNNQFMFSTEMGLMKGISGDAWVQIQYIAPTDLDDPFGEYPEGKIKLNVVPTSVVYPLYDPHDKDKLVQVTVAYYYEKITATPILGKVKKERTLFRTVWTKDTVIIRDGNEEPKEEPNPLGAIPFVQIRNLPVPSKSYGRSDLEDIVPMNTEYNLKKSDISEIIDYHSAPITLVFGAKIGNLEKGANKVWGGLPKDAKVENLQMQGDLGASNNYVSDLKLSMCEVAGIPESVLGGATAISNTSGVALQYANLPLIEKTRIKRTLTEDGLERINKLILLTAVKNGMIEIPEGVKSSDFYFNEVTLPDTLPKDTLMELQILQTEVQMGIESRIGALKRLGRENIEQKIAEVDKERKEHPELFGVDPMAQLNSGMMNGQTPVEQVRKELTGSNGKPSSGQPPKGGE
jgi:hypothetical protein